MSGATHWCNNGRRKDCRLEHFVVCSDSFRREMNLCWTISVEHKDKAKFGCTSSLLGNAVSVAMETLRVWSRKRYLVRDKEIKPTSLAVLLSLSLFCVLNAWYIATDATPTTFFLNFWVTDSLCFNLLQKHCIFHAKTAIRRKAEIFLQRDFYSKPSCGWHF